MPIHEEVLAAAKLLSDASGDGTFTPIQVVEALPHLKRVPFVRML